MDDHLEKSLWALNTRKLFLFPTFAKLRGVNIPY